MSDSVVSLLPSTVPSVVIHTSTLDVGVALVMVMVLRAGLHRCRRAELGGVLERRGRRALGGPDLDRGAGAVEVQRDRGQRGRLRQLQDQPDAVLEVRERHGIAVGVRRPCRRRVAVDRLAGLVRVVRLAARREHRRPYGFHDSGVCGRWWWNSDGLFSPSSCLSSGPPTSPNMRLSTEARTTSATTRIAAPTLTPMISPRRRRAWRPGRSPRRSAAAARPARRRV